MLPFPSMDPTAFHLGPIPIQWYGLMYVFSFLICWGLALFRAKAQQELWPKELVGDLLFYIALGVILGGRIGYVLIYQFDDFLANPVIIFKTWQGGMSFHGGLLGVLISLWVLSCQMKKPFLLLTDFVAPLIPVGIFLGRIGNFINGELWGRPTDVPWAMVFPFADALPRHPSQLYEALGEGALLFAICWLFSRKPRPIGQVSACFLIAYASIRFTLEFTRQPDVQLGFIAFDWLTMGQLLSLPMLLLGVWIYARAQPPGQPS